MAQTVTATAYPEWGAVRIDADLSSVSGVWRITITRTDDVTGEVAVVRSGDYQVAPGGYLIAYDMEAPLGGSYTYTAHPFTYLGVEIGGGAAAQQFVSAPNVTSTSHCWIKALDNPGLSVEVMYGQIGFLSREADTSEFKVIGRRNKVVHDYGQKGRGGALVVQAFGWDEIEALELLLAEPRLLVQFDPSLRVADLFASRGKVTPAPTGPRALQMQTWSVDLTEIDRPSTAGVPLRVPGATDEALADAYGSWADVASDLATWTEVAAGEWTGLGGLPDGQWIVPVPDGLEIIPGETFSVSGTDLGDGTYTVVIP